MITAFLRLQPFKSIHHARIFSNTAMTVESAANNRKIKNSVPQIRPPGIEINTFGSVTKIKFGPLSGLTPNVKQAGKMISPAISATPVSKSVMRSASPGSERFLSM